MRNSLITIILIMIISLCSCGKSSQVTGNTNALSFNKTEPTITPTSSNSNSDIKWSNISKIKSIDILNTEIIWLTKDITSEIAFTTDGGNNWSNEMPSEIIGADAIDFINDSVGWLVDSDGRIWQSNDSGKTWQKKSSLRKSRDDPNFITALQIKFSSATDGWILETFRAFSTNTGGSTWKEHPHFKGQPHKMFSTNSLQVWVLSRDELGVWINQTSNGGKTWKTTKIATDCDPQDIFFLDNDNGWVSCSQGKLFNTKNGGISWKLEEVMVKNFEINSIFWLNSKEGWLAGYSYSLKNKSRFPMDGESTLLRTSNGGQTWDTVVFKNADPFFSQVRFENAQTGYLIGRDNLYKTDDGGKTWRVILSL